MLNFNDFFQDRLLENLVNESALYFVKDFKDTLYKLSLKNKIAKDLIDVEYTDVEPDMTIISLGDEPGKIKFMQINNFTRAIEKGYQKLLGDSLMPEHLGELQRTIDMLVDKAKSGNISQTDVNYLYNSADFAIKNSPSRNGADLGRLVNKVFPNKYTDKEREEFVNQFKAALLDTSENAPKFELVTGDEIIKWYNVNNYKSASGYLGDSCMRYSRCSEYFGIYTHNPEVCQLLILKEENKILGRALVWKLEPNDTGVEYLVDRVYTVDDATKILFDNWADEKGYLRRYSFSQDAIRVFVRRYSEKNCEVIRENIKVKLKNWEFKKYPYMDTFKKLETKTGLLYNNDDDSDPGFYILTDTEGGYQDTSGVWSSYYDETIPQDEAIWSNSEDTYIWKDRAVEVKVGYFIGWYPEDSTNIVEDPFRGWINKRDASFCHYYGEWIYDYDLKKVVVGVEESSDKGKFNYHEESLSDEDPGIVISKDLDAYEYLLSVNQRYLEFSGDILGLDKARGKYYFDELAIKVYQTSSGILSEVDCRILNIDYSKFNSYWTDELAYNFGLKDKKGLIKKLEERIREIELYLSGQQPTIVFSQSQEEELKGKNKNSLINFKARLSVLKRWV
jgi:hypothetical protein